MFCSRQYGDCVLFLPVNVIMPDDDLHAGDDLEKAENKKVTINLEI